MHTTDIQIRFRDTDGVGHVNNAVFLSYLELARINFINQFNTSQILSMILARVEIDYKHPIRLKDEPMVETWVNSIGTTSWSFGHNIIDRKTNQLFAKANAVQVVYNYEKKEKEPIPPSFRSFLGNHLKNDI